MSDIYLPQGLLGKGMPAMYVMAAESGDVQLLPQSFLGRNMPVLDMTTPEYPVWSWNDSYGLSDSTVTVTGLFVADAFAFASAFTYLSTVEDGFSDSFAFSDKFQEILQLSIADAFAFTDTITLSRLALAIADAYGLDDSFSPRIEVALSMLDSWAYQDGFAHALRLGINDAFAWADSFVHVVQIITGFSDSYAWTDAFSEQAIFSFSNADGFGMLDDDYVARIEAALSMEDSYGFSGLFQLADGEVYLAWVLNTRNAGAYKYKNYPANSFAKAQGRQLMCCDDGIYEVGGETDDGAVIGTMLKTGAYTMGTENEKRIDEAYLAYTATGETLFKILFHHNGKKVEQWYRLKRRTAEVTRASQLNIHRGIESSYFQFALHSLDGKPVEYEQLTLHPVVTQRIV